MCVGGAPKQPKHFPNLNGVKTRNCEKIGIMMKNKGFFQELHFLNDSLGTSGRP